MLDDVDVLDALTTPAGLLGIPGEVLGFTLPFWYLEFNSASCKKAVWTVFSTKDRKESRKPELDKDLVVEPLGP